jgi:hypothetical protein
MNFSISSSDQPAALACSQVSKSKSYLDIGVCLVNAKTIKRQIDNNARKSIPNSFALIENPLNYLGLAVKGSRSLPITNTL